MSNIKSAAMITQLFWGGLGQTVGFLVAEKSLFFFFYPDIRQNSKPEKRNGEEEFEDREKNNRNP